MARKVKTLEELALAKDEAHAALKTAQDRFNRAHKLWQAAQIAEEAKTPITLEAALETYIASGENTRGWNYLNDLTWKGEWKDTGFGYAGSYWIETNQYMLRVTVNHKWDDAKLEALAKLVEENIQYVKAGCIEKGDLTLSKTEKIELGSLKVLDIFDRGLSEYASWYLALADDGRWIIFDGRNARYSWGGARKVGTLMECLKEIRSNLWYEGGERSDDCDDED